MFPKPKTAKPKFKFRTTPPPNYNQRSVKLKVFAVVAIVMVGLFVWEKSREKDAWKWLARTAEKEADVQDRLLPKPGRTAHDPPGTIVQTSRRSDEPDITDVDPGAQLSPEELAWRQGWKEIYVHFDATERSLLHEVLAQGRGEHQLGRAALDQASKLVQKLDENWRAYGESAFQSLTELQPNERESWEKILRAVNERWLKQTQPALEAAAQGQAVAAEQRRALDGFQHTLDQLSFNLVKDDAPLRPDESDLWFRLMTQAQRTPAEELAARSQRGITYVQLTRQSGHYRGDLINIRGTVRGAWKSPAVNNPWGIKDYYVLWIHPRGGPNAPVIVHLQELPEGFPEIKERPADGSLTKLHEDVTVDGYFFKRQAYLSADGPRTAPLVLARTLNWDPEIAKARTTTRWNPSLSNLLWVVAGTFAASLLAAAVIYWRIREQDRHHLADDDIARADMSQLQGIELTPSVAEGLKQLEQDHGRRDTGN
jgi:hypothetical protein